jgi:hypothetical protein
MANRARARTRFLVAVGSMTAMDGVRLVDGGDFEVLSMTLEHDP